MSRRITRSVLVRKPLSQMVSRDWKQKLRKVSQWPIAYTIEVEKRLRARPNDVRLERRTRSGGLVL